MTANTKEVVLLTGYERFRATSYFSSLDGLRCVSILGVIWHHASGCRTGLAGRGDLGVDLFFAISGFLITTLLLRERDVMGSISLRDFYIRRGLRIFPLYYAMMGVYLVLVLFAERGTSEGRAFLGNLVYFSTYTSNWFVQPKEAERVIFLFAWSLATEEQFYLVWPSTLRFGGRGRLPIVGMVLMLVLGETSRQASTLGLLNSGWLMVRMANSIAAPICLGSLFAYALHSRRCFNMVEGFLGSVWSMPVLVAGLTVAMALHGIPVFLLHCLMASTVAACCINPDHMLKPLLANPLVRYIGMISYGMYLMNMLAVNVVRRWPPISQNAFTAFLAASVLTIVLAGLSHWCYERPFLRLKNRFRTEGRSRRDCNIENRTHDAVAVAAGRKA